MRITGPYGRFVYKPDGRGKSLFIAGGVGVTPFLSIIDTLKEQSLETPVHLLWLCFMETDFFDREEVEDGAFIAKRFLLIHRQTVHRRDKARQDH